MPNGDYEQRVVMGEVERTGVCAGCGKVVAVTHPHVIRYSTDGTPGGIFHAFPSGPFSCAPTGPQWFGVGEGDEAPDL